ncbi:MAG: hypothetical protein M3540_03595, partial [Actinomycetota bacterium]|nr:hypothetical protein [Actinomycetota bacterium]
SSGASVQSITFTSNAPVPAAVGGGYVVSATASSGLPVAFTASAGSAGVCTVSGSSVSFVGAGACTVLADQAGNASYQPAPQVQQSFTVSPPAASGQTIAFTSTAPSGAVVGGPSYTISATASSGLPVSFSAAPSSAGVCTVSGATVALVGAGTCTVNANQAGNASYQPAPQVQQSFTVSAPAPSSQTITFTSTAPNGARVGGPSYGVSASASSGLPVSFSAAESSAGICTVSGTTVSFVGVGTCTVDANQAGNASYQAAPQVQQSFAVAQGTQTITFTSDPGRVDRNDPPYTVTAVASSGLAVTFTADPSSAGVCTVSGSTVSFIGRGDCTINANQAGNANYLAAPQAQQTFKVKNNVPG